MRGETAKRSWFRTGVLKLERHSRARGDLLADAQAHLTSALDLLDLAQAPAQIGAHVDLALNQLAAVIEAEPQASPVSQAAQRLTPG